MGDKILPSFAKLLEQCCAGAGFCARYGSEERVIILPNHSLTQASSIVKKIRLTTQRMKTKQRDQEETIDRLTTSLGIARYRSGKSTIRFIDRTDNYLYRAKEADHNKIRGCPR